MAEYSWKWSGSSDLLLLKDGNDTVATISGFSAEDAKDFVSLPTDSNGGITIGKGAASLISDNGISLTSSGAYWLELGADVSTYYAIDTSSTTIDGGVIKGSLSEYYTLSNNVISKTKSVAGVNFATISGGALESGKYGSLAGGTQITLVDDDLQDNYSTVSANDVVTITANNNVIIGVDKNGDGTIAADETVKVNVDTDIFSFVLSDGKDAATTLGFADTLDNAWTSSGKAAIYNKVTGEGWTSDGKTIDYTKKTNTALATISGFKDNVDIATVESGGTGSKYPVVASAQAVSVGADGMFYIARTALTSTEGATGVLTLTKSNSNDTYQLAFKDAEENATILGLADKKDEAYWVTLSGGGFAYQYNTDAGWTLKDNTITYTKARSTTAGGNAPTGVMTVTGSGWANTSTVTGFSVPAGVAGGAITISSSAFASTSNASLSFNYASDITDTEGNDVNYNLTFADNTATLASMAADPDIKVTVNDTNASITGDIAAWLSKTDNTVNYYAFKNDYAIATINGLKSGAQFSIESDKTTLILDKNDLTNTNVTLSVNSVAAGIEAYQLTLASGVADSVLQEAKHLNTSVDASLTAVDTSKGEVTVQGTALEYYTLGERSEGTLATHVVTYNAPETVNLAKITGLSEDAKTGTNISVKTEAGADRTIQLSQTALQSGSNVQLINSSLTSGNSHGLKLELVEGTNTVNVLGNKDSGDYWSVSGGTATYQHYKKEGWTKRTDELISYDAAGAKDVRFKVEGLNTNLVNDTGSEESSVMAAVSVSGNATNGYTAVVDTEYLAVSATNATIATVGAENSNTVTFKLKGDDGTAGKDSKANDNRYGFVNEDAANRYWSVSGSAGNYTATYMYDIGEGWALDSATGDIAYHAAQNHKTLVQISGLKGLTSSDSLASIDGISIDSAKKTFSLDSALLGDTAISLTAFDNADSLFTGSKLALADDNGGALDGTAAGDGSIGFGAGDKFWSVESGTALYKQYTNEGWALDTNATLISHTSITSAADAKGLATVSGVLNTAKTSDFAGITIVEPTNASTPGTITLNQYVMPTISNDTVTTVGVEGNYKLALESGIPTLASGDITTALHFDTVAGSATLKETRDSGWVTSTNDTLLTYHPTVDKGHATLTGLKAGDISANIGFDSTTSLISVKEGALTSKNASLESEEYTLQMVDSLGNADSDSMFGFGNETKVWVFDNTATTTAYYASKTDEGWSLKSASEIVYTSGDWDTSKSAVNAFADSTYSSLAAISNLKSGVTADDLKSISISSRNVVSIHPSLASASTESSLQTAISDGYTLKLLGDDGTGDDATKGDGKVGFKVGNAYWVVESMTGGSTDDPFYKAVYYQDKAAGWSIDSSSKKISYTGLQQATLATIENLKGLTVTAEGDKTQTTLAGVTVDGKNFKLANTALGTLAVSLTQGEDLGDNDTTYKLVLAGDTGSTVDGDGTKKGDGAVGFIAAPNKWRFNTTDSLAVYEYEVGEGWSVGSGDSIITYTAASDQSSTDTVYAKGLATIANLNPSLTVEDGAIAGITVSGNTISLAQEVLGASVTTSGGAASLISATAGTYKLKLADDTGGEKDGTKAGDNKIGFIDTDKYWAAANSSVTYQYDTSAGWVLDTTNNVVTYTQAKSSVTGDPTVIFTITGLASNVAASGGQIAGIALGSDKKTITISDKDYLFTSLAANGDDATVKVVPGTGVATGAYVLALGSDLATAPTYAETTGVTVGSGKATIKGTLNDYFTLAKDKTSITHTASKTDQALAIVGNLNETATSGVSLDSVSGGNGEKTVIVLAKGALDSMNVKVTKENISGVPSYTFNFATDANDSVFTTANTADGTENSTILAASGGKAAITGQTKAYYTIDNTKGEVVYHKQENVTLATVMGLTTNSIAADDVKYGNGIVSIKAGALGQGRVYIDTNDTLTGVDGLSLQLVNSLGNATSSLGFDGAADGSEWEYSGTTATYKKVTGEGWTYDSTEGDIDYTPAEVDVDAVITGLKAGALDSVNFALNDKTIKISTDALTNKSVVLTAKPGYKLELVENGTSKTLFGGSVGDPEWFVDSDGTAKYQVDTSKSWQLNDSGDIITYTAEKTGNTANVLAEITGLKSGITAADLKYGVSVDASNGKFILSNNLLGTGDIKLTDTDGKDYKLALGSDVAQTADVVNYWTTSGTTATYKKDSSAYYTLDSLGTGISYNAAVTGESIVKLKNLKKGVTATSVDGKPAVIEGITVAKEATAGTKDSGVIVVSANVLGTETADSKLFQLATDADKDAYVLTLDNDIATTAASLRAWTYGATSELKLGNNAYYSVVGGDSIKYTAETGTGTATKPTTLVKITGLSKNTAEGDVVETTEPTKDSSGKVTTKGVITLSENAFNNAKVSLSTGKDSYVLAFAESLKPQISNEKWTLNKTTATYKGDKSAGYTLSTKGDSITYSKAQSGATLLTISGLPKDITEAEFKDGITLGEAEDGVIPVTIDASILKRVTGKVTLKGTGYKFVLPDAEEGFYTEDSTIVKTDNGADVWTISGTTATYKRVVPAYYKLTNDTTISYVKEATAKVYDTSTKKNVDQVYATVGGLAKGLVVENGVIKDKAGGTQVITVTEPSDSTPGTITLAEAAYGTSSKITVTNKVKSYTPTLTGATKPATGQAMWTISGTTATYKSACTTEGWGDPVKDAKGNYTVSKTAANTSKSVNTVVTVSGLVKGLKVSADGTKVTDANGNNQVIRGTLTLSSDNKSASGSLTINRAALGTTNVTIKNATGGTVTLTDPSITSDAVGEIWSLSGTTLTISRGKTVGYTLDASGKIVYSAAKAATKLVTIKGLKKGLALNSEGTIDGINFGADGTVTVDKRVLGTSSVTLSGTGYKLALSTSQDEGKKVTTSINTTMWSVSGTKATLKNATTEGYVLSGNTIKYNKLKAGKTTLAVVDGLKKGLKANADGTIDGITTDIEVTAVDSKDKVTTATGTKIILTGDVLDNKTVSLTNVDTHISSTLALDMGDGVKKSEDSTAGTAWKVNGTTATLYATAGEGYSYDSVNKKLVYNNGTTASSTVLAKVENLKKSLKVNADGTIDGIKVYANGKIELDNRVLNGKDVTIEDTSGDSVTYTLALDYEDTDNSGKNKVTQAVQGYKYTISGNKVTIKVFTPAGYTVDGSGNVVYSKAVLGDTVATIEGVVSGLKANSDGTLTGIDASGLTVTKDGTGKITAVSGTLKLDKEVLGSTDISITNNAADNSVKLDLAEGIIDGTATQSWYTKDGASVLTVTTKKGYSANADGSKISYTASDTEKVSLIGLTNTTGVTVDTDKKIVTVPTSALGSATQVELTGGDYTLVLQGQTSNEKWEQVNDTTARYVVNIPAGGYGCDGTRIIKNTTNATKTIVLATLTGLPESLSMSTGLGGIVGDVDSDGYRTITLPTTALSGTSNITLSGSGYKLAVADDDQPHATTNAEWSFDASKGTATYSNGTTAGYTVSADGKTATYSAFKTSGTATATVTGLNKDLTTDDIKTAFGSAAKELTINNEMVGGTNIKVTGDGYTLKLGTLTTALNSGSSDKNVTPPTSATDDEKWAVSGSTATFKKVKTAYYTINSKATEITYTAEADVKNGTIVKIDGLASGLTVNDNGNIDGITLDASNGTVVLGQGVLGSSKISLTSGVADASSKTYTKLVLEDDVPAPESTEPQWKASGTTATLTENSTEGYVVKSDTVIEHVAAKSGTTLATLTNLKSGLKADEDGYIEGITLDTSTNVITLSNDVLGTSKISLSGSGYTLDLDRDNVVDDEDTEVKDPEASWKVSGTTATYARYTPAYYKLNGNAIEYVKESSIGSAIASITGVNNFDADSMFDGTNKVTLYAENLSNNVKIAGKDENGEAFTLELGGDVDSAELESVEWSKSGSNATLKGNVSAGYALNATSTEVTYSSKPDTKTFATVNGVKETPEIALTDTNNKEITLEGENLESAVSISSGEGYIFNFSAYENGTISGSTGNDSISVDSNGLTINLGKGDDYIDLAKVGSGTDTIVYASGDGNDVIANFGADDKLKVTGVKLTNSNITKDGSDTVIKIGSGSIKLEGVDGTTGNGISIVDGNGNNYTIVGAADLLDSDNFLTAGNSSLEDLVQPVTAIGTLDESLTDPQDLKTLTKQSNLVAYLNSRKK